MIGKTNVSCRINSNFLWISWCLYKNSESKYPNEIISRKLRGKKHPRNADCLFGKGFCGLPLNHPRGRGMFEGSASIWPCDKRRVWWDQRKKKCQNPVATYPSKGKECYTFHLPQNCPFVVACLFPLVTGSNPQRAYLLSSRQQERGYASVVSICSRKPQRTECSWQR